MKSVEKGSRSRASAGDDAKRHLAAFEALIATPGAGLHPLFPAAVVAVLPCWNRMPRPTRILFVGRARIVVEIVEFSSAPAHFGLSTDARGATVDHHAANVRLSFSFGAAMRSLLTRGLQRIWRLKRAGGRSIFVCSTTIVLFATFGTAGSGVGRFGVGCGRRPEGSRP